MRTRLLGPGGPEVSVVGLGTNNFGGRIDYERSLTPIASPHATVRPKHTAIGTIFEASPASTSGGEEQLPTWLA